MLLLAVFLAGCGTAQAPDVTASSEESTVESSAVPTTEEEDSPVTLTFTSDFGGNLENLINSHGIIRVTENKDGSIDVTMEKRRYDEFVDNARQSTKEALESLEESEQTPYIKEVICTENFECVTIKVDRPAYESAFDLTEVMVSYSCLTFQAIAGVNQQVKFVVMDVENCDVILSDVYS